jgi:hypothetical protein
MKTKNNIVYFLCFFLFICLICRAEEILSAKDLIQMVETQYQGATSHGQTRMTIKTAHFERNLELEIWSEARDKFLTRILSPAKERGTCTLKVDDNIWNYIPKVDRMIRIPSSLMGESWMGSHFTNDDLVKENKIDQLYDFCIIASDSETIEIEGIPLPDAAVVWGKVRYKIEAERKIPVLIDYFDEEGVLVRTIKFSRPRKISGRWVPFQMTVLPVEKPDEFTKMEYLELKFDVKHPRNLFSLRSMRTR